MGETHTIFAAPVFEFPRASLADFFIKWQMVIFKWHAPRDIFQELRAAVVAQWRMQRRVASSAVSLESGCKRSAHSYLHLSRPPWLGRWACIQQHQMVTIQETARVKKTVGFGNWNRHQDFCKMLHRHWRIASIPDHSLKRQDAPELPNHTRFSDCQ